MGNIKNLDFKSKILLISLFILGIFCLIEVSKEKPSDSGHFQNENKSSKDTSSIDTIIPKNHVLVPVEISNADSLISMIDGKGVVDLYLPIHEGKSKGRQVGKKLKLIQAPLNPDKFAVLVHESQSSTLLSYEGPFIAVLQHPDAEGDEIKQKVDRMNVHIDYQN